MTLRRKIGRVAMASTAALVLGQLVSFAQTIALARLLSPREVGFFAAGSVLTSFFSNFVEGGLRAGLIHHGDDLEDAAETVFWATLGMGFVMSLGALAAAPAISAVFDSHTAGLVAASMAGSIVLYSLTNVPEALLQKQFSVRRRLIVGPAVAATFAVVSVWCAALGLGVWSMVIGSYASHVVWVATLWLICDWRPGRGKASIAAWRKLARFGFPLVLGIFGDRAQQVFIAGITGSSLGVGALGLLRYGERISRIPVSTMIEVSSNALFPAFAQISGDPDRFRAAYLRALALLTVGGAAVAGMMAATGEPLVVLVLGEKWRGAGLVLVAMAGLGLGKAFATVSEEAIKGAGRTQLLNWYTLTEAVLSVVLLLALIGPLGLFGVGLSISLTALATGFVVLFLAKPVVGVSSRQIIRATAPGVVAGLVALATVVPLEHLVAHSDQRGVAAGLGLLTAEGVLFLAVYAGVLRVIAPALVTEVVTIVRQLAARRRRSSQGQPAR